MAQKIPINSSWMLSIMDNVYKIINQYPLEILSTRASTVVPLQKTLTDAHKDYSDLWESIILQLVTDLKKAAEHLSFNCLGLAANQIWTENAPYPAVFVMRWPSDDYKSWSWQEVINPKVVTSGKKLAVEEGCLSLINKKLHAKKLRRRANVTLTYQTLNNNTPQTTKFYGHLGPYARIVQHEYDHLMGKLCID